MRPRALMIAVAPNGARKIKTDHPNIPLSPDELAQTAQQCLQAGACMIHLHVRDERQQHTLDVSRYQEAIAAVRDRVADKLIIQITTEAVGIYQPLQQMQVVRELKPEAVSIAVRELCPSAKNESEAKIFFHWMKNESILPQYILYSVDDVLRFFQLRQRGIVPLEHRCVLFVLGRFKTSGCASAVELLPMLAACQEELIWSVCAFGESEAACMLTAQGLGGHCRVGFENNNQLACGDLAPNNEALVKQVAQHAALMGCAPASALEARQLMGMI